MEWETILNQFHLTDEERVKVTFYAEWMPCSSITEADILQYPFLAKVKEVKQAFFRANIEERMDFAEQQFRKKKATMEECIIQKSRCLERAQMLGVPL